MTKLLIAISFLLFVGSPLANENKPFYGGGWYKCSALLKYERDREYDYIYGAKQWLLGYITGRNQERGSGNTEKLTTDDIYYYVINWCRKNPLQVTMGAANKLYNEN